MNPPSRDIQIIIVMAAVVILATAIFPSPSWYLTLVLLGVFILVSWRTRAWPDRVFYLTCSGILLVVACSAASTGEGLVVAWLLAGVIATVMGMIWSKKDIPAVLMFGSSTLAVALMIQLANHVLLPLLILGAATALVVAALAIRDYRFRKEHTGALL
jgi:hypothetical protein